MAVTSDRDLKARAREARQDRPEDADGSRASQAGTNQQVAEVDVERAAHLYSAENAAGQARTGNLQSESEARSVLERLKARMAANPEAALAAFAYADPQRAGATLAQGPA